MHPPSKSLPWLFTLTVAVAASLSGAVSAQSINADSQDLRVCASRTLESGREIEVVAPAQASSSLERAGFMVSACKGSASATTLRESWRDGVCETAARRDEFVQAQAEKVFGLRPSVLCALAEIEAGAWVKPRSDSQ